MRHFLELILVAVASSLTTIGVIAIVRGWI